MGMNETPASERVHIGFFGLRNAGKSSLVNAITGQDMSVVSDVRGTTTDAVSKTMELLPLGPVVIIDTPGIDDEGALGSLRIKAARKVLAKCDIAVLVSVAGQSLCQAEKDLLEEFDHRGIPFVVAFNKIDLQAEGAFDQTLGPREIAVSAVEGTHIRELKELLAAFVAKRPSEKRLIADLLEEGDTVVLVVPIDESAPKMRIILPQQMVLRDCLDAHACCVVCQVEELVATLAALSGSPRLVVTDSQVFSQVAAIVSEDVLMTSFSILMARYKGELRPFLEGAAALKSLPEGSRVLMAEGCTHHRQCEDIGTVKIPRMIRAYATCNLRFETSSGNGFPDDISDYDLVVHCGACMLNAQELAHRVSRCEAAGVPVVNYGMAIAQMSGILERALLPFSDC